MGIEKIEIYRNGHSNQEKPYAAIPVPEDADAKAIENMTILAVSAVQQTLTQLAFNPNVTVLYLPHNSDEVIDISQPLEDVTAEA